MKHNPYAVRFEDARNRWVLDLKASHFGDRKRMFFETELEAHSEGARLVDVLRDPNITRALIFTRTKHGADKVVKALDKESYRSAAIHGNKSQANREKALAGFKDGKILALVAS